MMFVIFNDNPNLKEDGAIRHQNVIAVIFDMNEVPNLPNIRISMLTRISKNSSITAINSCRWKKNV